VLLVKWLRFQASLIVFNVLPDSLQTRVVFKTVFAVQQAGLVTHKALLVQADVSTVWLANSRIWTVKLAVLIAA